MSLAQKITDAIISSGQSRLMVIHHEVAVAVMVSKDMWASFMIGVKLLYWIGSIIFVAVNACNIIFLVLNLRHARS